MLLQNWVEKGGKVGFGEYARELFVYFKGEQEKNQWYINFKAEI